MSKGQEEAVRRAKEARERVRQEERRREADKAGLKAASAKWNKGIWKR